MGIRLVPFYYAHIMSYNIVEQTEGLLKALIDPKTRKILGCTLFCTESSD